VETFASKLKERQLYRSTGRLAYFIQPLFPCYIFARFRVGALQGRASVLLAAVNRYWRVVVEQGWLKNDRLKHPFDTSFIKSPNRSGDIRFVRHSACLT
jgi:hypothetical protein